MQSFSLGDSAAEPQRKTWQTFFAELDALAALERPWTLVLRDPLANSFVSSVVEDPRKDPRMQVGQRSLSAHLGLLHYVCPSNGVHYAFSNASCVA